MGALIKEAESQEAIKSMFELMTKKIEERILDEKPVILCVNNGFFECKTTVKIDTYEVDENHILLAWDNFEFNIIFDDIMTISYDNEYEECFNMIKDNTEINLYFL